VVDELDLVDPLGYGEGHPERVEDEIGAHVRCELPADDLAAVGVDDEREEDEAFPAAQIGEVRDPQLVAAGGAEVTLDQVGPPPRLEVGDRRPPRLPASFRTLDSVAAHQPFDPTTADLLALAHKHLPHPARAVGVVVRGVQLADTAEQPLVLEPASREPTAGALVVRGRRHAQGPADRLDPEAPAVLVDERAHFGRRGSCSPAKNTEAAFKISFARRSSKFSCRKRLISSRSSAVGRSGRRPSFASTWRTYLRSVSDGSPRSAATCAIGRPDSNTTRVARSNSSTGYFLDLGMTDLLPPANPAIKVSVKPGTAHSLVSGNLT
jgi:hypothetical protein